MAAATGRAIQCQFFFQDLDFTDIVSRYNWVYRVEGIGDRG
jgi:hypothetical protein